MMKKLLLFLTLSLVVHAQELQKVSLQLQWLEQFQFAGYIMAKEKGFYKEVGLEVELKKFTNTINPLEEVQAKRATYGIGRSSLIINKANGKEIKLLASIFQSSPSILLTTKEKNINTINDFIGKRVMVTTDASLGVSLNAMIMQSGVKMSDLILQKHSFNIQDLLDDKTDLVSAYISNEPFLLKELGIAYKIFDPKDYGFDFYSDILFTSSQEVDQHKLRTISFVNASIKGWRYAFSHIQESVDFIYRNHNPQNKSRAALVHEARELKKLAYYKTNKLGEISFNKIQRIYDIYHLMGYVTTPLNLQKLIFKLNTQSNLHFDNKELNYLQNLDVIKMCTIPDALPYSKLEDGKFIGISHDYIELISRKINVPFEIVATRSWEESHQFIKENKCDMLPVAQSTASRTQYLDFSKSYISSPLVIATTPDKIFVSDINNVIDKKFTTVKTLSFNEYLRKKYPNIKLIEVQNANEGLAMVVDKKAYGYIGELATTAHQIQKKFISNIQISGYAGPNIDIRMGVTKNNPLLLSILNKSINTISVQEKQKIKNKWLNVHVHNSTNYALIWKFLLLLFVIGSTVIYFTIKQNAHKKELQESQKQLENYLYLMLDGFAILDAKTTKFVFCNKEFENMTGYTMDELKKINVEKIHPSGSYEGVQEKIYKHISGETAVASNIPILHTNGDIAIFDADIREVVINEQILYFGNFRSLSQNIQKQHRLREENIKLKQMLSKYQEDFK